MITCKQISEEIVSLRVFICCEGGFFLLDFPFSFVFVRAVAAEICEELFTADPPRIGLALNGVEVFLNASGSHHQLRKLNVRIDAIKNATLSCGGVYMYSNHQGCDGARLYYGMWIDSS